MNASERKMMKARRSAAAARIALCLGAGASLGACVPANPFATTAIDPASSVAGQVQQAVNANKRYPTFAQIPAAPTDVRPPQAWASAVADAESARASLERNTAPETWTLKGTEAFASKAQAAVGQESGPAAREGDADDFSRRAQERATPPPPPR